MTSVRIALRTAADTRKMPAFPAGDLGALAKALNLAPPVSLGKSLLPALNNLPLAPGGGRLCDFLDPPGSPTVALLAYGLKDGHRRALKLTYSVSGSIPGNNLAATVGNAFKLWAAVTAPGPGRSPALQVSPALSGAGDIAISVGNLPQQTSGSTTRDGSAITISSTFPFSPAGSCSLFATVIHEVGHALGMLHSTSAVSVMNPANCSQVTLAPDDIAGIRALYGWQAQFPIPGVGTDESPALCACGNSLVMAWKGIDETNLWVSRSDDGINWTPQARVSGAASTDGPSLAWDGSRLWMMFRGIEDDDGLYWTTCTDTSANFGQGFSPVQPIPNTGSANGPSVTIFNGSPLVAWRGIPDDDGLYFATFANGFWSGQQQIGGLGSNDRPSLCVDFNNQPRMVWRGIDKDDALYTSALVNIFWQPQELVQWIIAGNGPAGTVGRGGPGSDIGPSIAIGVAVPPTFTSPGSGPGNLYLVWRGVHDDSGIYFTQGAPGAVGQSPVEWSTQALIEGVGTSHRPAIALLGGRIHVVWKGVDRDHTIFTTLL